MARLYSLLDATAHDEPGFGRYEAGPDGAFPFPDEVSARLGKVHHGGQKAWETQGERQRRLHGEDLARRRDPAVLYDTVAEFTAAMRSAASPAASPDVAALVAQVEALTARLAAVEGQAPAAEGDDTPAAKTPGRRKTAATAAEAK